MSTIEAIREEVAAVRAAGGGNPRIHPNGFIQLDLEPVPASWAESHQQGHSGAARRLHIWNPPGVKLPRQGTVNEVHDHVFDMRSEIIRGQLWQRLYELRVGTSHEPPSHKLYRAVYQKNSDSRLEDTGVRGVALATERFAVAEGHSYVQGAGTFHDTETPLGLVVTVMTKERIVLPVAHVLVPIDVEPDNSYDRASAMPAEEIWEAIDRSLS